MTIENDVEIDIDRFDDPKYRDRILDEIDAVMNSSVNQHKTSDADFSWSEEKRRKRIGAEKYVNVFCKDKRKSRNQPSLEMHRVIAEARLKMWHSMKGSKSRFRSILMRRERAKDWELYRASELALRLQRQAIPKPKMSDGKFDLPFDVEANAFLDWIRERLASSDYKKRGRRPDPTRVFKTAISLATARTLVNQKGGNWKTKPTAREITQVWFVLFGESVPHDTIKSSIKPAADFLRSFDEEFKGTECGGMPNHLRKAANCILGVKRHG